MHDKTCDGATIAKRDKVRQYTFVVRLMKGSIKKIGGIYLGTMTKDNPGFRKKIADNLGIYFDIILSRHITCFCIVIIPYPFVLAEQIPFSPRIQQISGLGPILAFLTRAE